MPTSRYEVLALILNGLGKQVRVLVFAQGEAERNAVIQGRFCRQ